MLIWTEPWSLALMMRLVALHLRGTYLRRGKSRVSKGVLLAIPRLRWAGLLGVGSLRGSRCGFSGGRLQVDKLAAVVLHFDGFWWVVRRVWVVLVVARVLICLVRAFQFFEVAVVACKFERAVGFASGTLPRPQLPAKPRKSVTCSWRYSEVCATG